VHEVSLGSWFNTCADRGTTNPSVPKLDIEEGSRIDVSLYKNTGLV
jgi:hypothetical protein